MANTASAKKRVRQIEKRTLRNRARRSRLRTFAKKVEKAIAAGSAKEARAALHALTPELMRAASKGVIHRNAVARKLARLSRRVKALDVASQA
ncbi:MAG: 30S ribosomal protein S20 [Elioraea sp.]|nr:30S ribosomal protein S20 [Elioraea sp.]